MRFIFIFSILLSLSFPVLAQEPAASPCAATDKECLIGQLEEMTSHIGEEKWKDQTYREIAKLLAKEKKTDEAVSLIARVQNPDTKAMTIRGIGMTAAQTDLTPEQFTDLFTKLRAEAEKIEHPPSYAIALTYIAMSQAYAVDDEGAMKTAMDMENEALRNKALGESAEIQAEHGRFDEAMKSIGAIESLAFRDKAYRTISKIFADRQKYDEALKSAMAIENAYQKSQSVLYILAKQITPEEVSLVE